MSKSFSSCSKVLSRQLISVFVSFEILYVHKKQQMTQYDILLQKAQS